jgi:hypothetical protein
MQRRLRRAAGIALVVALAALVVVWLLPANSILAEQRRLEAELLGKTRAEVQAWAGRPPYLYLPRDQWAQKVPAYQPENDEDAALGYWTLGPEPAIDGAMRVTFNRDGVATDVAFRSYTGIMHRLRRWLP